MAMIRPEIEMKDSGDVYIGKMPLNWRLASYKYFADSGMGLTILKEDVIDLGVPIYSATQDSSIFGYINNPKLKLNKGDLVIPARGNSIGCTTYVEDDVATCTQTTIYSKVSGINPKFLFYCSIGLKEEWFYYVKTAIPQITVSQVQNNKVPLPPLSEQQAIADYLDETCFKIDEIIAEAKASIDEYKELKQSVIFEAVTKGLNKNVEMKDSGIEWIGDIPVDWNIAKINRVAWTTSGATPLRSKETEYYDNAVIRWIRTLDLNNGHVTDSSEKITETALKNSSCSIMPVKTVCVAMYGGSGTIGKSGILEVECATNQAICSIVSDKKVLNPDYLHYVIMAVRKYWMKYAVGTRKDPNINQQIIAQMRIPIPQLSKQDIIVNHLDKVTDKCDSLISEKESLINDLEAYKKSLIYEVVTGKRRVV